MTFDDVLARLEGVHRASDTQATARCPAHDDRQASLTIGVGRDGRVLLTCWTGCELDAIVRALNMEVRELFPDAGDRERAKLFDAPGKPSLASLALPDEREIHNWAERLQRSPEALALLFDEKGWSAATAAALELGLIGTDQVAIVLRDLDGHVVNLLRYRPRANGRPKMLAEQGYPRRPLYVLFDDDAPVWIVEGEPDAISIAGVGFNAIGAPGASAKAKAEWLELVRGRDVIVCFDADEPGRKAALRWAHTAHSKGARSVRVVDWPADKPKGYDVGTIVHEYRERPAEAHRVLLELAEAAPPFEPTPREAERAAPLRSSSAEKSPAVLGNGDVDVDALSPGELVVRPLSSLHVERVRDLWRGRIPVGRVGIIFGPPGQGKSTLTALLVADVTRAGGRVAIASAEDDPHTTILPRCRAAGADIDLVDLISTRAAKGETSLVLPRDIEVLGELMRGYALVLIDPLTAHLGGDVNTWKEQDVRHMVLAPLGGYARETGCSVACVMHVSKSDRGDALSRISGSGGFGGAARFALLLGAHPDDVGLEPARRRLVLVHVKASEGEVKPALVFRRELVELEVDDDDDELASLPMLELVDDDARIEADSVLAVTDPDEAGAFSDAVVWLQGELIQGAKPSKQLLAAARERGDFSERTLRKAKRALRVRSVKDGGTWLWERRP